VGYGKSASNPGRARQAVGCLLIALSVASSAIAADLTGRASVIDGDTIEIHGQRIRLHGIDAPESRQTCRLDGKDWRCGQAAALALQEHIGAGAVTCRQIAIDRYKRAVSRCFLGGADIAVFLVSQGWALDWPRYSGGEFGPYQEAAKTAGRGVWKSEFKPPWEWRQ